MNHMIGSDAEALDRLAGELDAMAARLARSRGAVAGELRSAPWQGRSADSFRASWSSEHGRQLDSAAAFLQEAGHTLRQQADRQRGASRAESLWDRLQRAYWNNSLGEMVDFGQAAWAVSIFARAAGAKYRLLTAPRPILKASQFAGAFNPVQAMRRANMYRVNQINRWRNRYAAVAPACGWTKWQGWRSLVTYEPTTKLGQTFATRMPVAAKVLKGGGTVLGVIGVAAGAYETYTKFQEGGVGAAALPALSTVGSAMMLVPIPGVQVVGAAIVVGTMLWEHRESIGKAAGWVADRYAGAQRWAGEQAVKAVGSVARAGKKLVSSLNPFD